MAAQAGLTTHNQDVVDAVAIPASPRVDRDRRAAMHRVRIITSRSRGPG
jgi:hypothetical protein